MLHKFGHLLRGLAVVALLGAGPGSVPLRFNIATDPSTLNPLLTLPDSGASALIAERLIFEPLIDLDGAGRPVPELAREVPSVSNAGLSKDGRTLTFRLRRGVLWQDGRPVTSSDIVFTWRAIMDARNPVRSREGYDLIRSIATPDASTAIVSLRRPWAPAALSLFSYGANPQFILPAHLFGGKTDLHESPFNAAPVGNGPFRLVKWQHGAVLEFEAFEQYWRGIPATKRLRVGIVPAPETNLVQLRSGELDWNLIAPVQQKALAGQPGLTFTSVSTALVVGLALNTARAPLSDVRLRRALAQSIDRDQISRTITLGKYPVIDSDQPRYSWAYDPAIRLPRYDPAAADRAFDAAGWKRGGDGMRERNGRRLGLIYVQFPESTTGVRVSVAVQAMLKQRGVDVTLKSVSNAQLFLPAARGGVLWSGDWDMAYVPWAMSADPDDSYIITCNGAANYMRYCNENIDLFEARALSSTNPVSRKRQYRAVQLTSARDVPVVWLFNPQYVYARREWLGAFTPNPIVPTWNASRWRGRNEAGSNFPQ